MVCHRDTVGFFNKRIQRPTGFPFRGAGEVPLYQVMDKAGGVNGRRTPPLLIHQFGPDVTPDKTDESLQARYSQRFKPG